MPKRLTHERGTDRPRVLVLTSSLLTDRMLAPTTILPRLAERADVRVLASSLDDPGAGGSWPSDEHLAIAGFPEVAPAPFAPNGILRVLADEAWERRHGPVSRIRLDRDGGPTPSHPRLRMVGRTAGRLGLDVVLERAATAAAHRRPASPETDREVTAWHPDLTLVTSPFHTFEPGVAAAARRQGSRVIALVPSWDNLTTKGRMLFDYDGFLVWSEVQADALRDLYPRFADRPVHVVGTPQYDAFVDDALHEDRGRWCLRHDLDPDRPVVVYALGSPNMFDEVPAVTALAEAIERGKLGRGQLLVRCHPIHDTSELHRSLGALAGQVRVQRTATHPDAAVRDRTHGPDQLVDWVNTFRHADVVVNLSSTSAIDGMAFDRPIVNLDYDPSPGGRRTEMVHEINRRWEHFAPVVRSGAMAMPGNPDDLVDAVADALAGDDGRSAERAEVVRTVIGPVDGRGGDRFAAAVLAFLDERADADSAEARTGGPASAQVRAAAGRTWQRSRKEWRTTWRWGHNLSATARHLRRRAGRPLPTAALDAIDRLRQDGIASVGPGVLLPPELVNEVRATVDRLEADQAEEITRARSALTSGVDEEKVFLHQPLGDPVPLDLASPFARVAEHLAPIADGYFGLETQIRAYAVWHNLASDRPPTDSQLWHRDREDLQILKAFLYLDDVEPGHGPFWFAPGTHGLGTRRATARSERIRGVARSTDDDVAAVVGRHRWRQATGTAGSVVLADTRGYHKGGHATTGDRRLLMVLFTSPTSRVREWFDRSSTVVPEDRARRRRWARG